MTDDVKKGAYSLERALQTPYIVERMPKELRLAQAIESIFPDAPKMIQSLHVTDWPEGFVPPRDYPLRIDVAYDDQFLRLVEHCRNPAAPTLMNASRALANKDTNDLRDRYWELTDELDLARREHRQSDALSLSNERDALARLISDRREGIGHSPGQVS